MWGWDRCVCIYISQILLDVYVTDRCVCIYVSQILLDFMLLEIREIKEHEGRVKEERLD